MDNLRYPTLLTCAGGGVKRAGSVLTNWGRKPSAIFLSRQNRMKLDVIFDIKSFYFNWLCGVYDV